MAKKRQRGTRNGDGPSPQGFGRRLADLRKTRGYSQEDLAAELGTSQRMIACYEGQALKPPAHLLPTIAQALNITTDQLLDVERIPKRQPPLNRLLLRKIRAIEALPPHEQRPLLKTIDTYLKGAQGG